MNILSKLEYFYDIYLNLFLKIFYLKCKMILKVIFFRILFYFFLAENKIKVIENDLVVFLQFYIVLAKDSLEKILKSAMHQNMGRTFFQLPQKISFKE